MSARADAPFSLTSDALTRAARPAEIAAVPPYRRILTPAERRAEESTRVAREATDAAAVRRHAEVARLRAARLAKEADAPAPVKPAPKAKRAKKA